MLLGDIFDVLNLHDIDDEISVCWSISRVTFITVSRTINKTKNIYILVALHEQNHKDALQ